MTTRRLSTQDVPHPLRRNIVWRAIQYALRFLFVVWLRYRAIGLRNIPAQGPGLLAINHQSFLDPLLVGLPLSRPVTYLARSTLFPVPLVGWVLRHTYVIPLDQESPGTSTIRESVARLKAGWLVGVFPEGSRTETGRLGPMYPGFIALVRRQPVPVYPVGIAGAFESFPRGSAIIRPGTVRVVYGAPIPVEEVAELSRRGREEEFLAVLRERIAACCEEAEAARRRSLGEQR